MLEDLLPNNSTPWERAFSKTLDTIASVEAGIGAVRGTKLVQPPPTFLPALVYEYGLGELRPYIAQLYGLIEQGIDWQRIRGTHAAVAKGLGFLGYAAAVEEALARRRFWNSFQLRFPSLPPKDLPDLFNVAGVTTLSVPKRSKLRRGVHYYDVGPLETDTTRLDKSLLDAESGVALWQDGPVWSFGRRTEVSPVYSEEDGAATGSWLPPVGEGALTWEQLTLPWADATFPWASDGAVARAQLLASWFERRIVYVTLADAAGVIGHRLARSVRQVAPDAAGRLRFGGSKYAPSNLGQLTYVEALTGFGNGAGRVATTASLRVLAELAPGVPPGRQWLAPDEIPQSAEIAVSAVNIPLRPTVREEIKFLLRF